MRVSLKQAQNLVGEARFQAYACLDATGTREIFDNLLPKLNEDTARVYAWARCQQAPAVMMTLRGVRVDTVELAKARRRTAQELNAVIEKIRNCAAVKEFWAEKMLNSGDCPEAPPRSNGSPGKHLWPRKTKKNPVVPPPEEMTCQRCGAPRLIPKPFLPTSDDAVKKLLYTYIKAPKQFGKTGSLTADGDALDTLRAVGTRKKKFECLVELCDLLKECRDLSKQQGFLNAEIKDGRYYSSFNVGAAWTGRFSSSQDPFGNGGNLQNIAEKNRKIFTADPNYLMFYADLKTAESMLVAYLSGEEKYIEAHKSDVHTFVCREVWKDELPWTGDIKQDKKIATSHNPPWDTAPGHDYRFQSKRVQHGSNYGLTPFGMAIIAHIPVAAAKEAQQRYFEAFPGIRDWQRHVIERVERGLPIYNPFGRVVRLTGRPWDSHTHKQGLAFGPQSGVADILNMAMWRVFSRYDPDLIQILAQVHDAILGQFPADRKDEAIAALMEAMQITFPIEDIHGKVRYCTIPVEIAVGHNWGKASEENPHGLKEVKL